MNQLDVQDDEFRRIIQRHKGVGFGRMMQLISEAWYADFVEQGYPTDGIKVSAGLFQLSKKEQDRHKEQLVGAGERIKRAMKR